MPETISLRAYIGKLEDLLSVAQTDEVIHHCRHILQYFPRLVAAYDLLGRALLHNSRWDEARAVFQRVLSARPDDFTAHIGLSEVYEQKGQANDAIWHLERAFEQNPTEKVLIDSLRDLYKRHRNVDHVRIQLTAAAVARQQARAGHYERALDTLRTVLARMSDRIDLRLLMAETLWENDQRIEAAETALDVLELLPDCMDANAILTRLWLTEGRPSDAQRYLNHLEALDPYFAMELVQGQAASDETFTLEELDYRRYAQREMSTNRPDWLQELDSADLTTTTYGDVAAKRSTVLSPKTSPQTQEVWPDLFGDHGDAAPAAEETAKPQTDDLFGDLPDNWSVDWAAQTSVVDDQTDAVSADDFTLDFAEEQDADDAPPPTLSPFARPAPAAEPPRAAIPKSPIYTPTEEDKVLPSWLKDTPEDDAFAAELPRATIQEDVDPLAWLRSSDVEIDESAEPTLQDVFGSDDSLQMEQELADPLAWLRDSGVEIDDQQQRTTPNMYGVEEDSAPIQTRRRDPLAWLRDSGIELEEQQPEPSPVQAEWASNAAPAFDDLEWVQDVETILPELEPPDVMVENPRDDDDDGPTPPSDVDFFTWLAKERSDQSPNLDEIDALDEDPLEWLSDESLLADIDQEDDSSGTGKPRRS